MISLQRASSILALIALAAIPSHAQEKPKPATENDFYRMITFPLPKDVVLEVGGMDWLDANRDRLLVCTRRGELWVLDNVYADSTAPQVIREAYAKLSRVAGS